MCSRHRPEAGADAGTDWLRAPEEVEAAQAILERHAFLDTLVSHRLVPKAWEPVARALADDPDADVTTPLRWRSRPAGGLSFELPGDEPDGAP